MLALAAVIHSSQLRGDSPPNTCIEIPIKKVDKSDNIRSLLGIYSYFDRVSHTINTTITSQLGQVETIVTNLSTGETWFATIYTQESTLNILPISGTPGYYKVEYFTQDGDIYEGELTIE